MLAAAGTALWAWLTTSGSKSSVCFGSAVQGLLSDARRLPAQGANFRASSLLLWHSGRMSMHGSVREVVAAAYADVASSRPELRFVYGEASWPHGGRFPPHKTHRNGISVDFMMPVRDADAKVSEIPTSLANHFGYEVRFDAAGRSGRLIIDFDAMAVHLAALNKAASRSGIAIKVVVLDLELQPALRASFARAAPGVIVPLSTSRPSSRHDNHYHIDFDVPCRPLPEK
ncbi:MAG: penicillin-insensitive murein endopeptidase [Hyphomicrobiaceae bacterium]